MARGVRTDTYRGLEQRTQGGNVTFVSKVTVDGVNVYLGSWSDKREAAIAYDRAALHLRVPVRMNEPAESARRGPASPDELVRLARKTAVKGRGSSRYFGVCRESSGRFRASISKDRRTLLIASFDDEEVAAAAYDRVAVGMLGANTRLNFPGRRPRPATVSEIRREAGGRPAEDQSSRFRGVCRAKKKNKWHAMITQVDGTHHSLGAWDDERAAALAYDRAALHLLGLDARRNLPGVFVVPASPEQLQEEQRARRKTKMSSRHEGVTREGGGWVAYVNVPGERRFRIAMYAHERDAALAYNRAALHLFGVGARRNFPRRATQAASPAELRAERRAQIKRDTASRYRGVIWVPRMQKWAAQIMVNRRSVGLGFYDEERDAALAYDRGALHFHAARAKLNFPKRRTKPASAVTIHREQWARYKEGTTSRYTGVVWVAALALWRASIRVGGRRISLGDFDDEVAAARAYDRAADHYRGAAQLPQWINVPKKTK